MENKDLHDLYSALLVIKITKSMDLLMATENFIHNLVSIPAPISKKIIMHEYERLRHELEIARARTRFLTALLGENFTHRR